jgi:FlaG/FlaF family flagellin (archaellin)
MIVSNYHKGISTFIAALLMILLAVAAGVVIYSYTMGYLGGLGGSPQTGAMSLDSSTGSTTAITSYIRNIGKTTLVIDQVYVDGTPVAAAKLTLPASITEGATGTVTITDTFTASKTYTIKLIAKDNTQLSYSVTVK